MHDLPLMTGEFCHMSFVGGLFSGDKGANFEAKSANLIDNNQNNINQQQQGSNYLTAAYDALGKLSTQYQNLAQNGSPLANAQLTAATNQNVANAAGTIAGAKGLNPALAARLAGQNQTMANQQAANQAAQLQAQIQQAAMGQAGNIYGQLANTGLSQISNAQNQMNAYNQAQLGNTQQQNQANANIAGINTQGQHQFVSNLIGAGSKAATMGAATGGMITQQGVMGPKSKVAQHLKGIGPQTFAMGGNVGHALRAGGTVPGIPAVHGDSPKNDIVDAKLSPGEIVIPRTIVNSKDPVAASAKFVAAILSKKSK